MEKTVVLEIALPDMNAEFIEEMLEEDGGGFVPWVWNQEEPMVTVNYTETVADEDGDTANTRYIPRAWQGIITRAYVVENEWLEVTSEIGITEEDLV